MARFSSRAKIAGFSEILLPMIWGITLMLSVPAAIITSASPRRMRAAASATACRPEAQKRLMVMPGTVLGSPASRRPMRATFMPCSASGIAQPTTTSPISVASRPGTLATTAASTWASMSSGRTLLNMPLRLATGVRVAATM